MLTATKSSSRRSMTTVELEKKAAELEIDTKYKNVFEIAREVKEVEVRLLAAEYGITSEGKDVATLEQEVEKAMLGR
ncbi:hypothetical protein [Bacillus piscicola]|uniref:hypothetical protein n=1 Tax=Bacillus piscicola TaxID=1632684 RepID=UPI001F089287|nr:hypothetical protein [Bacillus piscicola]